MASENVLMIGWNRPVVGREKNAVEIFNSLLNYLNKQKDRGVVESVDPVLLVAHGGDLNGFVMVRGDKEKLHKLRWDEDFQNIVTEAIYNVDQFGVVDGWTGSGVTTQMQKYQRVITR